MSAAHRHDDSKGISSVMTPAREIADGIWWFPSCLQVPIYGRPTHIHNAPYLIVGDEKTLLWGTGDATAWDDVAPEFERVLAGRTLDYLVPSHPEIPHCGNVHRVLEAYPEVRMVGDVRDYHLFFPEYEDRCDSRPAGSELELGGKTVVLLNAIVRDLPSSQ